MSNLIHILYDIVMDINCRYLQLYIIMRLYYIIDIVFKLIIILKYNYNINLNTPYYNVNNEFHIASENF